METKEEIKIVYTGSFPFMTDIQIYNIAKETYVKTKSGPWQHYLDTLLAARNEGLSEAQGIPSEKANENDIISRMSESTKKALREPIDTRFGISSHSLVLAEEMRAKSYGCSKQNSRYVYKNPYLLPEEQMAELISKTAELEQPIDHSEDFDENGLLKHDCGFLVEMRKRAADNQKRIEAGLKPVEYDNYEKMWGKKIETQEDIDRQQAIQDKIEKLQVSTISKQKLNTFITFLGKEEKPYTVKQFRYLDGNYLSVFLNPAIEAGIIIKYGSRENATYKVNY